MPSICYWYRSIKTEQDVWEVILSNNLQKKSHKKKASTNTVLHTLHKKPITGLLSHQIKSTPQIIKLSTTSSKSSRVQRRPRNEKRTFQPRKPITEAWQTPSAISDPRYFLPIEMEIDDDDLPTTMDHTWSTPYAPHNDQATSIQEPSWCFPPMYNNACNTDDLDGDVEMINAFDHYQESYQEARYAPRHNPRSPTISTGGLNSPALPEKIHVPVVAAARTILRSVTRKAKRTNGVEMVKLMAGDVKRTNCANLGAVENNEFDDVLPTRTSAGPATKDTSCTNPGAVETSHKLDDELPIVPEKAEQVAKAKAEVEGREIQPATTTTLEPKLVVRKASTDPRPASGFPGGSSWSLTGTA
ncbi:hypothetical protein BGX38DRAFT_1183452 [Terfezia claveryi]|nr:hypothetical protein BGX38DRAFT_1183452 [Terfezia claveryi]